MLAEVLELYMTPWLGGVDHSAFCTVFLRINQCVIDVIEGLHALWRCSVIVLQEKEDYGLPQVQGEALACARSQSLCTLVPNSGHLMQDIARGCI